MVIEYTPHAAQMEIHRARGFRFRTVCTGRRFGKTLCMAAELLDRGGGEAGGDYAWVAPTYGVAERGVEAFKTIAPEFARIVGRMPARAEFEGAAGPCRVWFLSADNPDSIRGFGFRGIVLDEAAAVPAAVWNYVLRPTLAQTLGWAVFISTPMGRNWFYDMFTRGVEGQAGFKSFTFPSNVSPYFPAKEWEEARLTLPEDVFRQEYMAEFLEDGAGVFRGIEGCLVEGETLNAERPTLNAQVRCGEAHGLDGADCDGGADGAVPGDGAVQPSGLAGAAGADRGVCEKVAGPAGDGRDRGRRPGVRRPAAGVAGRGGVSDHGAEQAGTGAGADGGGRTAAGDVAGGVSGQRQRAGGSRRLGGADRGDAAV